MSNNIPVLSLSEERKLDDGVIKFALKVAKKYDDEYRALLKEIEKGGELYIGVRFNQTELTIPIKAKVEDLRKLLAQCQEAALGVFTSIDPMCEGINEGAKEALPLILPPWPCGCGQLNSSWAKVCGRCEKARPTELNEGGE